MTQPPVKISETADYVNYQGFVDEYPINFRLNKFTRTVDIILSDLIKAAQAKNKTTLSNLLLDNEDIMNQFLDLINTAV